MSILSAPYFHDEAAAYAEVEAILWPNGPVCPHCGGFDRITQVKGGRIGLRRCGQCKKQFTVKVGTLFESSHIPLHKWLQAVYLMCSSKKGISSHQMMRTLEVDYKTAWFLTHRIRTAMADDKQPMMGGLGKIVEIDETFIGQKKDMPKRRGYAHKHAVMTLIERGPKGGKSRSFHVEGTKSADLLPILKAHVHQQTRVMTDEAGQYTHLGKHFTEHDFVVHSSGEYGRDDVHINSTENFYSVFKRGMRGIYQHCSERHLHRYVAEFEFRYNNRVGLGIDDEDRTDKALRGVVGKRLTYKAGINK
jgi:transposase-like protein